MPLDLSGTLVVAVSSRALFDLEDEHRLYSREGLEAFSERHRSLEGKPLAPGPAFPLVRKLLAVSARAPQGTGPLVEVVIVSSQHPDTGIRILDAASHHGLQLSRAVFTGGAPVLPYLQAFGTTLLLTRSVGDAQEAIDAGIAAAVMYDLPRDYAGTDGCIRIALDGDAVLFSEEGEMLYQREGLAAFHASERANARVPLEDGPYSGLLRALWRIRQAVPDSMRIALVTARNAPAHERALRTLRGWGVGLDEAFFLGGVKKSAFLKAFRADLFVDDQSVHLRPASEYVPSGQVPYRSRPVTVLEQAHLQGGRTGARTDELVSHPEGAAELDAESPSFRR